MTQKLEDSGERRTFSTGAVRDRGDLKPRPDLISPHAQLREGMIHTLGSQKYAIRNWEQGLPISECLASAQRHIEQYKRGDTNEDHIAQARWNLGAIIHFEEEIKAGRMDPAIDDMPKYAKPLQMDVQESREFMRTYVGDEPPKITRNGQSVQLQRKPPTFYVAGPMRGYKDFNFPAFDEAAERGRRMGYNIISPADLDRKNGIDPLNKPGSGEAAEGHIENIIQRDIDAIMSLQPERGDGIAVLAGWTGSTGASAEVALARWLGLRVVTVTDFHTEAK